MHNLTKLFLYRKKLVKPYIEWLLNTSKFFSYCMSMVMVVTILFEHGFVISAQEQEMVIKLYSWVWITFIINTLLELILDYKDSKQQYRKFTWALSIALYFTLVPKIFPEPQMPGFFREVWLVFESKFYNILILATLSLLQLSNGIILLLGKRVKPSFIFSISFLIIILIGAGLLMLPNATYNGISFVDALFISTSATCVTGLATVDVPTTFTPMGIWFILALIQIGGIGVMTLTSFFAVFFLSNASIYNQSNMCDLVSSKSLNSLLSTLIYILGFTLVIEAIGTLVIFLNIHNTLNMTLREELVFSLFHSISAFCNAGFSTMPQGLSNPLLMENHNIFYITITLLIILGGIGFPILANFYETIKYRISTLIKQIILGLPHRNHRIHLFDINTRIVLVMTAILLLFGTVAIGALEWNGSFSSLPTWDKMVHAFFNSASPRTAGFSSIPISAMSIQTLMITMWLMVIGGGTQSTAGGIKVNVFAVILLNLRAILYGRDRVTVFNRELSLDSIRRSNSTLVLYIFFIFISLFALTAFEPDAPLLAILFEAISALSTVGTSLDLTPTLGSDSKLVIISLMFIGRVGVLTIMASIIRQRKFIRYKYPSGNIIIN